MGNTLRCEWSAGLLTWAHNLTYHNLNLGPLIEKTNISKSYILSYPNKHSHRLTHTPLTDKQQLSNKEDYSWLDLHPSNVADNMHQVGKGSCLFRGTQRGTGNFRWTHNTTPACLFPDSHGSTQASYIRLEPVSPVIYQLMSTQGLSPLPPHM